MAERLWSIFLRCFFDLLLTILQASQASGDSHGYFIRLMVSSHNLPLIQTRIGPWRLLKMGGLVSG